MEAEKELEKLERTSTRMYRHVPTGGFETLKNGKTRTKTVGKEFFHTKGYGEIETCVWAEKMMKAIEGTELMDLYHAIRDHMETHIYFLKKEEEKKEWALGCLEYKAYEHWPDFVYPKSEETIIWL